MTTATVEVAIGAAVPVPYRVVARREDTADTATLTLAPDSAALPVFRPGQFAMLTAFGVGEVPISLSAAGGVDPHHLTHTIRAVGAVSRALHDSPPGGVIGVRGPFGTAWDVASARGGDVLVVAGGIGLAPLRPVLRAVLDTRPAYRRVTVLVGGRAPAELLYRDELAAWAAAGVHVDVTVDRPAPGWTGHVGVVTTLIPPPALDPDRTVAFVCGPEVMMRFTARALRERGVPGERIRVSLERTMRCGAGWCGHCQLGPLLICRDGPVVDWATAEPLLHVREL